MLYNDELGVGKLTMDCLGIQLSLFLPNALAYIIINWFGFKFLNAELAKTGSERLLNNLKEGVFLFNESDSTILFMNVAAKRINERLMSRGS